MDRKEAIQILETAKINIYKAMDVLGAEHDKIKYYSRRLQKEQDKEEGLWCPYCGEECKNRGELRLFKDLKEEECAIKRKRKQAMEEIK